MSIHKFTEVYEEGLRKAHAEGKYSWPAENITLVRDKMMLAVQNGSFNKDGPAFAYACKKLGIKYTYKAIAEFISAE